VGEDRITEAWALRACSEIFCDTAEPCPEFLQTLELPTLRAAFWRRAKAVHPDRFMSADEATQKRQAQAFIRAAEAMEDLTLFLSQRSTPKPKPENRLYYFSGVVPQIRLPIGLFLYYRGEIHSRQLSDALLWQRRQRDPVGQLAQQLGWLDKKQIHVILRYSGKSRRILKFGERARALGFLTTSQVQGLLWRQRILQRKLGQYFITHGLLSEPRFAQLLKECQEHNAWVSFHARRKR